MLTGNIIDGLKNSDSLIVSKLADISEEGNY